MYSGSGSHMTYIRIFRKILKEQDALRKNENEDTVGRNFYCLSLCYYWQKKARLCFKFWTNLPIFFYVTTTCGPLLCCFEEFLILKNCSFSGSSRGLLLFKELISFDLLNFYLFFFFRSGVVSVKPRRVVCVPASTSYVTFNVKY